MTTEVEWSRLKAHELRALANENAVVVLPVASMEQHGPHLPVQVDSRIAFEVCRTAARLAAQSQPVAVLPAIWTGLSEHHMPFGGTITLDYDTYYRLLRGIVRSITRHGFKKILIVNGHGGNIAADKVAVHDLAVEFDAIIIETAFWSEAAGPVAGLLEDQDHVMHACEAETSVMLHLTPELVDDSDLASLAQERPAGDDALGSGAFRWRSFATMTANGVLGNPAKATAAKGEKLMQVMAEALARRISNGDYWKPIPDIRLAETGGVPLKTEEVTS